MADIVTNDDIHFTHLDSDGEQSSHDSSDTDWGSGDGSSSEESSLFETTVHIANKPNNDIDDSATDTTTGENNPLCRECKDDEGAPLVLSNFPIDESIDFTNQIRKKTF